MEERTDFQRILDERLAEVRFGSEKLTSPTGTPVPNSGIIPSLPDAITVTSYALGLWFCMGGPPWAAIASIIGDELDGRLARATDNTSDRGMYLDWASDIILTPLSLKRLGKETETPEVIAASPIIMYAQAHMKAKGERPPVGSARAVIMLAALAAMHAKSNKR